MKRRINYTRRRQLLPAHVSIKLLPPASDGGAARFCMRLELPEAWKLRPDARIYVEPYVKSTSMRFDFGTVTAQLPPTDTTLTGIDPGGVLFRVKIVDESRDIGLLLAAADAVRPRERDEGSERRSILPLRTRDLGNQMWLVEITAGEGPELVINNRVPGLRERLLEEPLLQGLVFPAALRNVLAAAFGDGEFSDEEWVSDWRQFAGFLGVDSLAEPDESPDAETLDQQIGETIRRFCDSKRFGERARAIMEGESGG